MDNHILPGDGSLNILRTAQIAPYLFHLRAEQGGFLAVGAGGQFKAAHGVPAFEQRLNRTLADIA
jgi:hypothetical protein